MANHRLQIVPAGSGFPIREDSKDIDVNFNSLEVGPEALPISQDGTGVNARVKFLNRLTIPQAVEDDEVARWDQIKQFVIDNIGELEWQPSVKSVETDPPLLPTIGDRYLIASPGTGDWSGHDWQLVEYRSTGWTYTTCTLGTFVLVEDVGELYVKNTVEWVIKPFESITVSGGLGRLVDDIYIEDLGVTTEKLALDAVTNAQLADDAVQTENIADNAITNPLIADDAVDTLQIKDDAVTQSKLANNSVGNNELINDCVDGNKIADTSVNTEHLVGGSVTENKIATSAVTNTKIGDLAVTVGKLADDAVETIKIKNLNVTTGKINDLAVTEGKLASEAVTNGKIGPLAVTVGKIANDAVETLKIKDLNVTTGKIDDLAVTNGKIALEAVTGNKILTAIKNRIGVATDTTMENYSSAVYINNTQNYPQAISTLDSSLGALETYVDSTLLALPQEFRYTVPAGGVNSLSCSPDLSWILSADALDITVRINGKLLTQSTTANPGRDYDKVTTSLLSFSFLVPEGAEIVVRKERTGGASGDTIFVVKEDGSVFNSLAKVLNFSGTGVTLVNTSPNEVEVVITAGSGGVDLENVTTDIVLAVDDSKSLGSPLKGWKALYLTDQVTGDKYRLEVANGTLQAVLEP